jgi:hypothetical protein
MKLFTVAEMAAAEQTADSQGNSYANMMETAGRLLAEAIGKRYDIAGANILVMLLSTSPNPVIRKQTTILPASSKWAFFM